MAVPTPDQKLHMTAAEMSALMERKIITNVFDAPFRPSGEVISSYSTEEASEPMTTAKLEETLELINDIPGGVIPSQRRDFSIRLPPTDIAHDDFHNMSDRIHQNVSFKDYCSTDAEISAMLDAQRTGLSLRHTIGGAIAGAWLFVVGGVGSFFTSIADDYRETRQKYGKKSRVVDIETVEWTDFHD